MPNETYLATVCEHLAADGLRPGPWQTYARRWARQAGKPLSGWLLNAPVIDLYTAAEAAGLPLPDDTLDEVVGDNLLSVVLAAHAVLGIRGRRHRTGSPAIGEALGAIPGRTVGDEALNLMVRQIGENSSAGFTRMLFQLHHVESDVDLRTVAALAYGTARRTVRLRSNPTGHGPETGEWMPAREFSRMVFLTRRRAAPEEERG
ncbi:hypothetical protein [Streptomyces sp. NPDC056061]|uniref:hypothetical protein n=1 Tax=Streptomyces sp. NPDC056061 TaxID=3345700 RepID=UPI0035E2C15E